jgi:hypothetical protein
MIFSSKRSVQGWFRLSKFEGKNYVNIRLAGKCKLMKSG